MTAITAHDYYQSHKAQEKSYTHVYTARPVKKGETIIIMSGLGIGAQVKAPSNGYLVEDNMTRQPGTFLTESEFKAQAVTADQFRLPAAKEDLPTGVKLEPVAKGDTAVVDSFLGIYAQVSVDADGFIVIEGQSRSYVTNFELTSCFNYAGKKKKTHDVLVVADKEDAPVKGIVLTEDVTFAFKKGDYAAPKGSILIVNADDEDGYTIYTGSQANTFLRTKPRIAKAHAAKPKS